MIPPGRVRIGQIFVYVGRPLALLFVWDVLVTFVYLYMPEKYTFPSLPLPLLGSAIVIYLGFRIWSSRSRTR